MYKRILVPTDVSDASRKALIAALQLAKESNCEVELFHVTDIPQTYMGQPLYYGIVIPSEQIEKNGEEALAAALVGIDVGDVPVHKKHIPGHPATAIIEESKRDFDLIVMGAHGHGLITSMLVGSVTQRVVAHALCPVLVVK